MVDGVQTVPSPYPVADTLQRLELAVAARRLAVFAVIDHHAAAQAVGLDMQRATVLVFGNPAAGTPVMREQPLAALDLPLRILVWEEHGETRVSFQEPAFVARRFGIPEQLPASVAALVEAALA